MEPLFKATPQKLHEISRIVIGKKPGDPMTHRVWRGIAPLTVSELTQAAFVWKLSENKDELKQKQKSRREQSLMDLRFSKRLLALSNRRHFQRVDIHLLVFGAPTARDVIAQGNALGKVNEFSSER